MIFGIIGVIVGFIMGLTGAGGALISIPLFMTLANVSLKDATLLSLVTVAFTSGVNLSGNQNKIHYKIILYFILSGSFFNFASLKLKESLSDLMIAAILTLVGVYSLWSVWKPLSTKKNVTLEPSSFGLIVTGSVMGVLTTLTGLGGGVILIPVLMHWFKKSYEEALPTSLATVFSLSLVSLAFQSSRLVTLIDLEKVFFLASGSLASLFGLRYVLKNFPEQVLLLLRKVVFTLITFYSVGNIFWESI